MKEPWLPHAHQPVGLSGFYPRHACLALRNLGPSGLDSALSRSGYRGSRALASRKVRARARDTGTSSTRRRPRGTQEWNNLPKAPPQVPPKQGRPLPHPSCHRQRRRPRASELTSSTTRGIRPTYGYARRPRNGSTNLQPAETLRASASPSKAESPSVSPRKWRTRPAAVSRGGGRPPGTQAAGTTRQR